MPPAAHLDPVAGPSRRHGRRRPPALLAARRELRSVHDLIDRRTVEVEFRPMVRPTTGDVNGLEALVRGPQGTPFESTAALLHAGAAVGRLGELGWIARAAAVRALADRRVDPEIALFFRGDARGLYDPCPSDLVDLLEHAARLRRCVIGIDAGYSSALAPTVAAGTDQLRAVGFDIALDGPPMGVPSGPMLRAVEPELITVDARALVALAGSDGPRAVPSLGEFYARTGRRLVAKHVEDAHGARIAAIVGADFSHGPRHGRPASLRATRL